MRCTLGFACAVALLAAAPAEAADGSQERQVRLLILDGQRPAVGIEVRVNYPGGERTTGTTLSLTTDNAGRVEFTLPARVFWISVPSLNDEVQGKRFNVPSNAKDTLRWTLRPAAWRAGGGE